MRRGAASDDTWMQRAVERAREVEGLTRPNPPVGAVLVRGGKIVGEGSHHRAGGPHAEIHALRAAGARAAGATLYVTLEPCSTTGRTPPCTDAILAAGVARVVVGVNDPNPAHAGRGLRLLRRRGVKIAEGVLAPVCEDLVAPFRTWILAGRPHLTLKLGMTLDGRIADRQGRSKWITGAVSRERVQALRRRADVIMVGAGTARADNPSLLPRPARGRKPMRVIVSAGGRLPGTLKVFTDGAADRTLVTVRKDRTARRLPVEILPLRPAGSGVSLKTLMRNLGQRGVLEVLCEGGGQLAGQLVQARLVDQFVFFFAPSLLGGGKTRAALEGADWLMAGRPRLRIKEIEPCGEDLCVRAVPLYKEE